MAKGICVKKKYTKKNKNTKKQKKKTTATIKRNESSKGYWSGDLADQVVVYVLKYTYRIGYITRRLSADSQQLWIANENRSPIYFDQSRSFKF